MSRNACTMIWTVRSTIRAHSSSKPRMASRTPICRSKLPISSRKIATDARDSKTTDDTPRGALDCVCNSRLFPPRNDLKSLRCRSHVPMSSLSTKHIRSKERCRSALPWQGMSDGRKPVSRDLANSTRLPTPPAGPRSGCDVQACGEQAMHKLETEFLDLRHCFAEMSISLSKLDNKFRQLSEAHVRLQDQFEEYVNLAVGLDSLSKDE